MMSIKSRILLASAASLLTLSACNADEPAKGASKEAVAATVNGTPISQNRVNLLMQQRGGGMGQQPDTPEARKAVIDQHRSHGCAEAGLHVVILHGDDRAAFGRRKHCVLVQGQQRGHVQHAD